MTQKNSTQWIKASKSGGNGGDCVEMRGHEGAVEVRDTKAEGRGPTLSFSPAAFAAWIDGAKHGEFDRIV